MLLSLFLSAYIGLDVVWAPGRHSMSRSQVHGLLRDVRHRMYVDTGVKIKIARFRTMRNVGPKSLDGRESALYRWQSTLEGDSLPKTLSLVLVPPIHYQGHWYMAGYAFQDCRYNGVAYATVELRNYYGVDRYLHSVIAVMHELAHMLSAAHDLQENPATIMHPDVLPRVTSDIRFSSYSRREIRSCARRLGGI